MGNFVKGDVVVLNFPFSDLTVTKKRPAFVLADVEYGDIVLCQITSKPAKNNYSVKITIDDFENGSLPLDSFVRADKFFTADETLILYKAGHINKEKINEVVESAVSVVES